MELLDLKIDVVFKDFFGDKSSQIILEDFINTVLKLKGKDPVFGRALARLERLSSDPKTRKAYENSINEQRDHQAILEAAMKAGREEGQRANLKKNLEEGKRLGFKKGIEAGRQKEKLEIAKALLKKLLTMQEVSKITGLSLKEIKALKI